MVATKGLGELFVELGLKGLGKTLGGLNAVSASFLLTKNAAEQAIKPLVNFSKQGGAQVMAYEKINAVTGLSIQRLEELKRWTGLNRIEFNSFVGELGKLQQNILQWKMSGVRNKGFDLLGIDPNSLDWQNPEKSMKQLADRAKEVAKNKPAIVALAFQELGLSQDLVYAYTKANRQLDATYNTTKKQKEELAKQDELWARIQDGVTQIGLKLSADSDLTKGLQIIKNLVDGIHHEVDDSNSLWNEFLQGIKDSIGPLYRVSELIAKIMKQLGKGQEEEIKDNGHSTLYNALPFKPDISNKISQKVFSEDTRGKSVIDMLRDNFTLELAGQMAHQRGNILGKFGMAQRLSTAAWSAVGDTIIQVTQNINTSDPIVAGKTAADGVIKQADLNNAKFNNGRIE